MAVVAFVTDGCTRPIVEEGPQVTTGTDELRVTHMTLGEEHATTMASTREFIVCGTRGSSGQTPCSVLPHVGVIHAESKMSLKGLILCITCVSKARLCV